MSNGPQTLAGPTVMEFRTKEDAEDCFMDMLEEFKVPSSWLDLIMIYIGTGRRS